MRTTRARKARTIPVPDYLMEYARIYVAAVAAGNRHFDTTPKSSFGPGEMHEEYRRLEGDEALAARDLARAIARMLLGDAAVDEASLKDNPEPGSRMFEHYARDGRPGEAKTAPEVSA